MVNEVKEHEDQRCAKCDQEHAERAAQIRDGTASPPGSQRGRPQEGEHNQQVEVLQQDDRGGGQARGGVPTEPAGRPRIGLVDQPPCQEDGKRNEDLDLPDIEQTCTEIVNGDREDSVPEAEPSGSRNTAAG